jgi:ribosomal protein S27AE
MKNSKTCPKCQSGDILRIGYQWGDQNFIPLGTWKLAMPVRVTRYLCGACGYSEEWIDSRDDIEKLRPRAG